GCKPAQLDSVLSATSDPALRLAAVLPAPVSHFRLRPIAVPARACSPETTVVARAWRARLRLRAAVQSWSGKQPGETPGRDRLKPFLLRELWSRRLRCTPGYCSKRSRESPWPRCHQAVQQRALRAPAL